jgi:hypothetical protein
MFGSVTTIAAVSQTNTHTRLWRRVSRSRLRLVAISANMMQVGTARSWNVVIT